MKIGSYVIFVFFVLSEFVVNKLMSHEKLFEQFTKDLKKNKVYSSYFSRLSNVDRKRWIAEEHYLRLNYGIHMVSDNALESIKSTVGRSTRFSNDPMSYNILLNPYYAEPWQYHSMVLCQSNED